MCVCVWLCVQACMRMEELEWQELGDTLGDCFVKFRNNIDVGLFVSSSFFKKKKKFS